MIWTHAAEAESPTKAGAGDGLSTRLSLHLYLEPAKDTAPEQQTAADLAQLELIEDAEHRRAIVSARAASRAHHFVLMVDLAASRPADRFRALPPTQEFLVARLSSGNRVTLALWGGRRTKDVELLCSITAEAAELNACFQRLKSRKSIAHQAAAQRGESVKERLEEAHQALARAIEITAGTGLKTSILYLGAAASGLAEGRGRPAITVGDQDTGAQETIGTVQYLVALPRSGPLRSLARGAGDRLTANALEASASIFPLLPGRPPLGQDAWLANETGGRPLDIGHLRSDLERLGDELDRSYELVFERPPADSRFHRLALTPPPGRSGRWPRGFYAATAEEDLNARARAAALLGATSHSPVKGHLRELRRAAQTVHATLHLSVAAAAISEPSLVLHLAVLMADGRLLRNQRQLPLAARGDRAQIRLPLRFDLDARALGVATRFGEENAVFSWRLDAAGPQTVEDRK